MGRVTAAYSATIDLRKVKERFTTKPKFSSMRQLNNLPNNLWLARKRLGLSQKCVAVLLGRRSVSVVSEYERGVKTPPLTIALKLQLIYQTPLAELFPTLQSLASVEVATIRQNRPHFAERETTFSNPPVSTMHKHP